MDKEILDRLTEKINQGTATEEELGLYNAYMNRLAGAKTDWAEKEPEAKQELWAMIEPGLSPVKTIRLWPRIAAAASILVLIGLGTLFIKKQPPQNAAEHILPGSQVAILKTHGKTIKLDKTRNGLITGTGITKAADERLTYQSAGQTTAVYDTIEIPAGGRPYTVKLSDGSQILLNAATTLRYPESGRQTLELLSGEIYADIIHNEQAQLTIKAAGQLIKDIGTKFDVSAYPDEADSRTTLIEGAVSVNSKNLKPGQQAVLAGNELSVVPADLDETIAWTQGDFSFNGQHIDVIMRQLARWYNIQVSYQGKMTSEVFYGRITRKKNISEVLRMLEKTQKVQFKVEGRRVTVLSKS